MSEAQSQISISTFHVRGFLSETGSRVELYDVRGLGVLLIADAGKGMHSVDIG